MKINIIKFKPINSSLRHKINIKLKNVSLIKNIKYKSLKYFYKSANSISSKGHFLIKNHTLGKKKLYRIVTYSFFILKNITTKFLIIKFIYDPYRTGIIQLGIFLNGPLKGFYKYLLSGHNIILFQTITIGKLNTQILNGNIIPLKNIQINSNIFNIETIPNTKCNLIRSAGVYGKLLNFINYKYAKIKLPSNKYRIFNINILVNIGRVSNINNKLKIFSKAGSLFFLSKRPHIRGVAMNPFDHPHGGGKGKSYIGYKFSMTPWKKKTFGIKTYNKKSIYKKFIIK